MAFKDALIAASPALLGLGQQLSGRNPTGLSTGVAMMNAEAEKAQRKANIEGLLQSMQISQQKRDFLSMLPFEQQAPILWDLMNPKPMGGGRAPTQAEIASAYAASLGGMPETTQTPTGGGYSMGAPVDVGAPVAASGGLSLGRPAAENPAPATTQGLSFGQIRQTPEVVAPVDPYAQLRTNILRDLPRIQADALRGVPGAQDTLNNRLSQLKALEVLRPAEAESTEADREIARLMSIGMSREEAIKLKEGVYKTVTDPITRETYLFDVQTRQALRPIGGEAQPTENQKVEAPTTPDLSFGTPYAAAADSFGAEGFLKGLANTGADIVGAPVPFSGVQSSQSDFRVLRENLTNKISAGYNGRVPAFLLQNIQELTPKAGSLFEGPEAAQSKLQALARSLVTERDSVVRQLSSRALSPTDRANLETQLSALESSLADIGNTLSGFRTGAGSGTTSSGVKFRIVE